MKLRQLMQDDDAVSPVIGVILMVAITVILAAVIASFVLGLGDQAQQTTPTASMSFDYSESDTNVTITHDGGDSIPVSEVYVRGSGFTNSGSSGDAMTGPGGWETNGTSNSNDEVTAGNYVVVHAEDDYDLRVVYEATEGDTSATLGSDKGPAA